MQLSAQPQVGCLGFGTMGSALMLGLEKNSQWALSAYNRTPDKLPSPSSKITPYGSALEMTQACDVLVIAVKPYAVEKLLQEIAPALTDEKLIISVAAGINVSQLRGAVGGVCPCVRVMPNTPAQIGAGAFALCFDDPTLTDAHTRFVSELFGKLGTCFTMAEAHINAFTALVGAGPAYVFYMMDALAQAGVAMGFAHDTAVTMVQALFDGSVRMSMRATQPLPMLQAQVCSPGGVTIAAINHMDMQGVRGKLIEAVLEAYTKGKQIEKK